MLATIVFVALFALTFRRGATDPVCGMTVDRTKAVTREHARPPRYLCSERCAEQFRQPNGRRQAVNICICTPSALIETSSRRLPTR